MPQKNRALRFVIVIPSYNEEQFIGPCLQSLVSQNCVPEQIVVVDDSSTDNTPVIIKQFEEKYTNIKYVHNPSASQHKPGSKVINAFKRGLSEISLNDYDVICKFDADLNFPLNYLESLNKAFVENPEIGLFGGVCSILKNDNWAIENLTNLDHVRGALKAYRIQAFNDISGLQSQMGWDTADEFKLRYRNWQVDVDTNLQVMHYKPTTVAYKNEYFKKQGEVFYALRYGLLLTCIASFKIALRRQEVFKFYKVLKAYSQARKDTVNHLLTPDEGRFLRNYRWKQIFKKITP